MSIIPKRSAIAASASIASILLFSCGDSAPPEMPYGTAQQFMANEVQPTAEIYWDAVGAVSELIDGEPVFREFEPETDDEWEQVRASAQRLGEFGEIMLGEAYSYQRGDDWNDFAQGLVDVSARAEQAAIDHNVDGVFEVGGTIYAVCTACHQSYPPAIMPEGGDAEDFRPSADMTLEEYTQQED